MKEKFSTVLVLAFVVVFAGCGNIGIAFMPDTVDRAQVETIAQSVNLMALA